MAKEFLLGVIKNQIIVGEFEVKTWNGYPEFTASFSVGEAFNTELSEDEIKDWWEEYWYCLEPVDKLDCLDEGEITKEEWLNSKVGDTYYQDIKDCSCTDLEMKFNDEYINFESICCGQCDVRTDEFFNEMKFTNKEAFDKLMNLWDNYHLGKIDGAIMKEIDEIENLLSGYEFSYGDKVEDFIRDNLEF